MWLKPTIMWWLASGVTSTLWLTVTIKWWLACGVNSTLWLTLTIMWWLASEVTRHLHWLAQEGLEASVFSVAGLVDALFDVLVPPSPRCGGRSCAEGLRVAWSSHEGCTSTCSRRGPWTWGSQTRSAPAQSTSDPPAHRSPRQGCHPTADSPGASTAADNNQATNQTSTDQNIQLSNKN